jgi:hypothetical protein
MGRGSGRFRGRRSPSLLLQFFFILFSEREITMQTRSGIRSDADAVRHSAHRSLSTAHSMPNARATLLAQLQQRASHSCQAKQLKARADMMASRAAGPVQRVEDELLQAKPAVQPSAQITDQANETGMPNQLKAGIETLSGMRMDHVRVHYNSDRPAQLNAHAYAQGSEIHIAPGQDQHLAHEAWHVVQQMQGRVRPTTQMKGDVPVNDDAGLEAEADIMGARAANMAVSGPAPASSVLHSPELVRQDRANRVVTVAARRHYHDGWGDQYGITSDAELIAAVSPNVQGQGTIDLGWWEAPAAEARRRSGPFEKQCTIEYDDGEQADTTVIIHCGPSGAAQFF